LNASKMLCTWASHFFLLESTFSVTKYDFGFERLLFPVK
jgi:hypothetical protein